MSTLHDARGGGDDDDDDDDDDGALRREVKRRNVALEDEAVSRLMSEAREEMWRSKTKQ